MPNSLFISACPAGVYEEATALGATDDFDIAVFFKERISTFIDGGYQAAFRLHEVLTGTTWKDKFDFWFSEEPEEHKLALIGGDVFLHDSTGDTAALRCSTAEEVARAVATMERVVASGRADLAPFEATITSYLQFYRQVRVGEEALFYGLT